MPELDTSVFIIPGHRVKNGDEPLEILNRVAKSVIDSIRGLHRESVFVYRGKPVGKMHNRAWQSACRRAGLALVRVHDLKHTKLKFSTTAGLVEWQDPIVERTYARLGDGR